MRLLILFVVIICSISIAHLVGTVDSDIAIVLLLISLVFLIVSFYYNHASILIWVILSSYAWASYTINNKLTLVAPVNCQATIQLIDFPKMASPTGESVKAKVINHLDCPLRQDGHIIIRAYQKHNWTLGEIYNVELKVLPSSAQYLGKKKVQAYTSLVKLNTKEHSPTFEISVWRSKLSNLIEKNYSANNQHWWQALLIGNRGELDSKDWDVLRRTGTAHLLAISGLHLAIVASVVFWIVQILCSYSRLIARYMEPRSAALILALFISYLYSQISGAQPPVMRAWIMFAVFSLHWFYAPMRSGIQALLLTAILLLLHDVYLIFSASAWLSFYATSIVILSYRKFKHLRPFCLWLTLQAIITIALWPIIWALFGGISLLGYVVNIIVVPWLWLMLILGYLGSVIPLLASFADAVFTGYLNTIYFFADFNVAYLNVNWQPTILTAFCLCLAMILWLASKKTYLTYASLLMVVLGGVFTTISLYPTSGITTLQSSPFLGIITDGHHHTYVINAGYRGHGVDQAQSKVLPYLRQHALTPDAIILTSTNKRATTALTTLLEHYPEVKLYSTVVARKLPFAIKYCPQHTDPSIVFIKDRHCAAEIAGKWHINH